MNAKQKRDLHLPQVSFLMKKGCHKTNVILVDFTIQLQSVYWAGDLSEIDEQDGSRVAISDSLCMILSPILCLRHPVWRDCHVRRLMTPSSQCQCFV